MCKPHKRHKSLARGKGWWAKRSSRRADDSFRQQVAEVNRGTR